MPKLIFHKSLQGFQVLFNWVHPLGVDWTTIPVSPVNEPKDVSKYQKMIQGNHVPT
jgi:hypothetical protein